MNEPNPMLDRLTSMTQWCDAYSICIEVQAQAAHDPHMRAELADASKKLRKEGHKELSENQDAVSAVLAKMTMDDYHEKAARWRDLRHTVMAAGWDLAQDITFEQVMEPKPGILVFQNEERDKGLIFGGLEGMMVHDFLEFVRTTSEQNTDPRAYVRAALEAQGVTEQNFDAHARDLWIENPWKNAF